MRQLFLYFFVFLFVFSCKNNAINDLDSDVPFEISIITPLEYETFGNNTINFTGTAQSPSGISKIELSIDSNDFFKIDGRTYWEYSINQDNNKLPEGNHIITIKATAKDGTNKIKQTEIIIDREEPVAQFLYTPCQNNGVWNIDNVNFQINEVSSNNQYLKTYQYRINNGAWSTDIPVRTPISLNSLDNGYYTIEVVSKNNREVWQSYENSTIFNFEYDENAVITNFSINNNDIITTSADVILNSNFGSYITSMHFSNTPDSYTTYDSYSDTTPWELDSNDYGLKTVYAIYDDIWSNQHTTQDDILFLNEIILDDHNGDKYNFYGTSTDVSASGNYMAVLATNTIYTTQYDYITIYEKKDSQFQELIKLPLPENTYVPSILSQMLPKIKFSDYGGTLACALPGQASPGEEDNIQLIIYQYNGSTFEFLQSIKIPHTGECSLDVNEIGDVIALGVPTYTVDTDKYEQGAVFIYEQQGSTFNKTHTIIDTNFGNKGDNFGASVALAGGRGEYTLVIGAPYADVNGLQNNGYVSIYELYDETWTFRQRLTSNRTNSAYTSFGFSVSLAKLSNNYHILVSAPKEYVNENMDQRGVVYLYERNRLNYKYEIKQCFFSTKDISIGSAYDEKYGHRIYINNNADAFIVGATGFLYSEPDYNPQKIPSIYLYKKNEKDQWTTQKISVMNQFDNNSSIFHYGIDFGMSDDLKTLSIGSYGQVYIYYQ